MLAMMPFLLSVYDAAALTVVAGAAVVHGAAAAAARADRACLPAVFAMEQVIFHDVRSFYVEYFNVDQTALSNRRFRAW